MPGRAAENMNWRTTASRRGIISDTLNWGNHKLRYSGSAIRIILDVRHPWRRLHEFHIPKLGILAARTVRIAPECESSQNGVAAESASPHSAPRSMVRPGHSAPRPYASITELQADERRDL